MNNAEKVENCCAKHSGTRAHHILMKAETLSIEKEAFQEVSL